jgi:hypothetical protein
MGDGTTVRTVLLGIAALAAALLPTAAGAEPPPLPSGEPLAVEASAIVPIDDETTLVVVGIVGQVKIEAGEQRELRVVAREPGLQGADRPIGIWQQGNKLIVAPAPTGAGGPMQVHIDVPRTFAVLVDATNTDVAVLGAGGRVELTGNGLRGTVYGASGPFSAELTGGTLTVISGSDATIRSHGTSVEASEIAGSVSVTAVGGTVRLTKVGGSTDVGGEDASIVLDAMQGQVLVKAKKADVTASGGVAPAEFQMSGAALHLKEGTAEVTVVSDALVEFRSLGGPLRVDLTGGTVRGKGISGTLDVHARNAEINVESIDKTAQVSGEGLKAKLVEVGGAVTADVSDSDVDVQRAAGVKAKIDRGSFSAGEIGGLIQATVVGGDVHIADGTAAINLDQDGGDADVAWTSMTGDAPSDLVNKSGSVTVTLPQSGPCRVEAKSQFGRIDSTIATVKVADDLASAQGPVNGGGRTLIKISANRDIRLQGGSTQP